MWGCPQPHTGHPGGVPSLHTGDAKHRSSVGSGKRKEEVRKILSSPPPPFFFFLFTPFFLSFFFSPSCPGCDWRPWALPTRRLDFQGTGMCGMAGLTTQPSAAGTAGAAHQRGSGCSHHPHLVWGTLPAPWHGTTHAAPHINQPRLNLTTGHLPDPTISLLFPWYQVQMPRGRGLYNP